MIVADTNNNRVGVALNLLMNCFTKIVPSGM